ncbi:mechanosensitive ion channel family protein [Pseudobutyrivibrio xylanivorans]|uniref:Small conductance mechanosensitive channel n=1 Tax=Pseudobutyrivibrio xylanivorans DSM 14809 TaxID=1123012 RepID=A0A1M6DSQ2_PSEXY|nr:mechanosensitive ion channel domain-containing protein [Pseudobutyrivibrio xylanivorans]SHI76242.1 small conductance mechanosensitive channel [Pseudobutyrivibrio xylanivorans DSM 14809]
MLAAELETVTAEELVEDIQKGVIQQQLEGMIPKFWSFGWSVVLSIVVFFVGTQIIKGIIKVFHRAMSLKDVDPGVETFLESVLKWIFYIILITIILGLFGVTTTSISAAVAGLGVTIGLALQGALSNFAGGVLILLMHPFRVGDYIIEHSTGQEGTVEKINIIYTTLKMIDGRLVQVPNGLLSSSSITNNTSMTRRMFNETVGISYDSDIKKAKEIMKAIAEKQDHLITDEPVKVFVAELADSSVQIGLRFWVETEYFWQTKWDVLEEIKNRFDKEGVEICFNQLDVHIKEK